MWFLARMYDARQALDMGLVNTVVPLAELEAETLAWWGAALASLVCVPVCSTCSADSRHRARTVGRAPGCKTGAGGARL